MSVRGYGGFGATYGNASGQGGGSFGAPYWPAGSYSSPGYYNQALARADWVPDWANMDGGVDWPPQGQGLMYGPGVNAFLDGSGVVPFMDTSPVVRDGALAQAFAGLDGMLDGAADKLGISKALLGLLGLGVLMYFGSGHGSTGPSRSRVRQNPRRKKYRPWGKYHGKPYQGRFKGADGSEYRARHNARR